MSRNKRHGNSLCNANIIVSFKSVDRHKQLLNSPENAKFYLSSFSSFGSTRPSPCANNVYTPYRLWPSRQTALAAQIMPKPITNYVEHIFFLSSQESLMCSRYSLLFKKPKFITVFKKPTTIFTLNQINPVTSPSTLDKSRLSFPSARPLPRDRPGMQALYAIKMRISGKR
jgi:hypothetical protein